MIIDFINLVTGLIGVLAGSLLSWFSNKWVQNKTIKTNIQIKVAEHISVETTGILDVCHRVYDGYHSLWSTMSSYLGDDWLDEEKRYRQISIIENKLSSDIDQLLDEFESMMLLLTHNVQQ